MAQAARDGPFIAEIRENLEAIRSKELKKTLQKLNNPDPAIIKQLDALTRAIVNKILHPHLVMIKKNESPAVLDLIRSLFLYREENEKALDSRDEGE